MIVQKKVYKNASLICIHLQVKFILMVPHLINFQAFLLAKKTYQPSLQIFPLLFTYRQFFLSYLNL